MPDLRISLLIEDLLPLLSTATPGLQLPALHILLARSDVTKTAASDADELRFDLFGVAHSGSLPVAALTCLADRREASHGNYYYLRADPVTLWADLARVIMTSHGFADLDAMERHEIENTIRGVFLEEGLILGSEHPERWTIALEQPLGFNFSPLKQALGMDLAEALPEHPEARRWRRLLNEIQVALHACPVNLRRRQEGRQEINSVWFWGGGYLPPMGARQPFRAVYSDQPVCRGLALAHDCELHELAAVERAEFPAGENGRKSSALVVDWSSARQSSVERLLQLDALVSRLLAAVKHHQYVLEVHAGDGTCWTFDRRCARRFWRRGKSVRPVSGPD